MSIKNQETLMRFIDDVWNNGRLDTIDSYLAPEYTIHHDPGDPWEHQTLSVDDGLIVRCTMGSLEPIQLQWWRDNKLVSPLQFTFTSRESRGIT